MCGSLTSSSSWSFASQVRFAQRTSLECRGVTVRVYSQHRCFTRRASSQARFPVRLSLALSDGCPEGRAIPGLRRWPFACGCASWLCAADKCIVPRSELLGETSACGSGNACARSIEKSAGERAYRRACFPVRFSRTVNDCYPEGCAAPDFVPCQCNT